MLALERNLNLSPFLGLAHDDLKLQEGNLTIAVNVHLLEYVPELAFADGDSLAKHHLTQLVEGEFTITINIKHGEDSL